ncbi:ABC transporter permease [Shimwellia blattae]|uniref:Transport permease protein n=1 Tax=Shimwellia blattae (strain ATCC 29907 / DSM 4481 / JCM 1650 / NBRC 105725 / CDC 9005-74) TaxID=630626 RepID=I2B7P5_SHIBC|nr:ABC transporter permease [Shimwellia blattae]AFJ46549.1 putative ABC-type polysaccharide transport system [Shimwellia blattae DSM 4481 = NBRC 105725]GAB80128.1 putative ABC transporter permease protein [Shimwellia blattae DSM 4481 = NBRC 105725]VDY64017.1 Polysialic acid transport protein kpsM [Shimwellia blattae]VEC22152.1 Polysialic acid transport protein kpsM [Shimwellia blattae]
MKYNLGYLVDLVVVITNKELKVRYKSSFFGYLWSIANPLLFAMIYYFIFKLVMRVQIPNYTVFLITGLFPWQWFASSATNSLFSFIANAQIIKKTVFPRSVIPLSNVMMEGLHFLCTIPVIIVFLYVYDMSPSFDWLWGVPLIAIGQIIFTFGVSLIFSTLNLFFRDLERFVSLGIMLMFYCTPILYASDMIPESYGWIITYNPLASMIISWRDLFMNGVLNYEHIGILYLSGIILLIAGQYVFNKLKYRFAEIL